MPLRLSLPFTARQCQTRLSQSVAGISTTSKAPALQKLSSPAKNLLSLGDEPDPTDTVQRLVAESEVRQASRWRVKVDDTLEKVQQSAVTASYLRQMPRRWAAGDVYAPHDLSPSEMARWRRNPRRKRDVMDMLGINPLDMYRNFSIISEFMTPMGRIKHSDDTGLRPVNQRKMAKAIRRAIGMGLHPSVHYHPEILRHQATTAGEQTRPSRKPY